MITKLNKNPKIGVIGVGHLGKYHLNHLLEMPQVECMGFYDIDTERSKEISNRTGARAFSSLKDLIEVCNGLTVVVPTQNHFTVASKILQAGKHAFIEKPIATTSEEADKLIALSEKMGVRIQVGHIERFNPALLALNGMPITPKYIETHRLAPYTVRGTDVPVILDLMIHDLDIILSLVKSPVKSVHASGISIMTQSVDIANARLQFENGCVANITSSRIAKDYVRKLRIFQTDLYVTIDFLKGLTEIYRLLDAEEKDPNAVFFVPLKSNGMNRQIVYETPQVDRVDALRLELENFALSITGKSSPIVGGQEGREALRIATIIHDKIEQDIH